MRKYFIWLFSVYIYIHTHKKGPSSARQTLEPFQRQHWGNFPEPGRSTYGPFWAPRHHLELNWTELADSRPFLILSRKILNLSKNQNISSTAARQDRHKTLWKESINGENTEHRTLHSPFFCQALAECGCMRQRTSQTPRCCRCGRGRNPSPARQVRQTWHHVPAQHKWNKICVDPNKGVNACVFCPINSAF